MRTLQRTRLHTPPRPELHESKQALGPKVKNFERKLWLARLRWISITILVPVLLIVGVHWFWNLRIVATGLVVSNTIAYQAPAAVRVVEVFCQDGQSVKRGDPLLRLEARGGREQRRAMEYLVEQRRLRLNLAAQGADLGSTDLARRTEMLVTARDEFTEADGDYRVAIAELERLWKERSVLLVTLRQKHEQQKGDLNTLEEKLDKTRLQAESAEAEDKFTAFDIEASSGLLDEGLLSSRAFARKEADYLAARRDWEALDALVRTVDSEFDTLARVNELERRKSSYRLQELDAQVETQKERVRAVWDRRALWDEVLQQHASWGSETSESDLRRLEMQLLRAELREAEALLEAHDHATGNRIVRAESDGVIDRVHVAPGNVIDQDAELITYYDPWTQWCTAYLPADVIEKVDVGMECQIVAEGSKQSWAGTIMSMGRRWSQTPAQLLLPGEAPELLLPVRIDLTDPEACRELRPNTRLRVFIAPEYRGSRRAP